MLPILLMQQAPIAAGLDWAWRVLVWEIGGAVLVGAAAEWLTSRCMDWARGRPDAEGTSLLTVTISLALATTAGVRLLGGDEILAAFVAGAVLNNSHRKAKVEEHHERFSEALGRFFDLPVMICSARRSPGGPGLGSAAGAWPSPPASCCSRRMPARFLLGRLMPWTRSVRSAAFAGSIGAAALFYAMMTQDETGSAALWPAISLAIGASVLAHGTSSTPLTRLFGRWQPVCANDDPGGGERSGTRP